MISVETTSDIRTAALQVAALGLRIHPLIGKRPIWEDWPSRATSGRAAVARMLQPGRNYGIVCDRVAVIDTDTAELAAWWLEHMPRTPWMVRTPRGGAHFYYRSVPGLRNATGVDRGWDVRAGGRGYAVGFASRVDGTRYALLGAATLELPPFDRAWLPAIRASPVSAALPTSLPERAAETVSVATMSAAAVAAGPIHDLRAYIRRIKSIQGARGSDACFRVACILRDAGLSPAEALAYLAEWNQSCADPPWSLPELEHKVSDAFAVFTKGG